MNKKNKIFFSRTYRHLKVDAKGTFLYCGLFVLPLLVLLFLCIDLFSDFVCTTGIKVLAPYFPGVRFSTNSDLLTLGESIHYIDLPTVFPSTNTIFINLGICICLLLICMIPKIKTKPIAIYVFLNTTIHLVNCIFFLFAKNDFSMTAVSYSEWYMKQQTGIWLAFVILAGFCTAFVGNKGYIYKIITVVSIMIYSLVFGAVRYILFLFILMKYSIFYVAVLYFVIGPILDFLYFVIIYAFYVNKMVSILDSSSERGSWEWL